MIRTTVNNYFATSMNSAELIQKAIEKAGGFNKLCKLIDTDKSTLWRMRKGKTTKPHDATIGKLYKVAFGE